MNHPARHAVHWLLVLAALAPTGCIADSLLLGDSTVALEGVDIDRRTFARFAGDVDGDGLDDVLVWGNGNVAVVSGRDTTGELPHDAWATGQEGILVQATAQPNDFCSDRYEDYLWEPRPAGDLNGDGLADFTIMRHQYDDEGANITGVVILVVFGTPLRTTIVVDEPGSVMMGLRIEMTTEFGLPWMTSAVGDVDGDGLDDLAVWTQGTPFVAIVRGRTDHAAVTLAGILDGTTPDAGWTVSADASIGEIEGLGDFDGDGIGDVAFALAGMRTHVMRGPLLAGATISAETALLSFERPLPPESTHSISNPAGYSGIVRHLGDVNGDGLADLAVGAPSLPETPITYVVHGSPTGGTLTGAQLEAGEGGFVIHGQAVDVRGGGDMNGDGLDDLVLGAFDGDDGSNVDGPGGVLVVFGRESTAPTSFAALAGSEGFMVEPGASWLGTGRFVDMGDFDGDGLDDILFGTRVGGNPSDPAFGGEAQCQEAALEGRTMIRFAPE